jgi:ketosteroid isomerase-like protein
MRLLLLPAVVAAACALAAGPLAAQAPPPADVAELPTVALPPALERVLRDYERAWGAGDAAALAALFAPDGFVLQGGRPPVRGRAAIQAAYAGQGGGALRLRALAWSAADSVGFLLGGYRYGDAPRDTGKFTLTLRRGADGRWLIFSDMDNPNASRRPGAG